MILNAVDSFNFIAMCMVVALVGITHSERSKVYLGYNWNVLPTEYSHIRGVILTAVIKPTYTSIFF